MLKTLSPPQKHAGKQAALSVQIPIGRARELDRQVISGEVAAGSVIALGQNIEIGLASDGEPKVQGRNQFFRTPLPG